MSVDVAMGSVAGMFASEMLIVSLDLFASLGRLLNQFIEFLFH